MLESPGVTLTAQLLIELRQPAQPDLSPDATRIAWSAAAAGRTGEHPESAIFVAPIDGAAPPRQWTHGGNSRAPAWAPDGTTLAFLSDRHQPGTAGIYAAPAAGGEARPLVTPAESVGTFRWSPDGGRIAYTAADSPDQAGPDIRGETGRPDRLWVLDVGSGASVALTESDRHVREMAWSPDGSSLAYLATPAPELDSLVDAELYTVDATGGAPHRLAAAPWAGGLRWGTDRLVFAGPHGRERVASSTVWAVDPAGAAPVVIGPGPDEPRCADAVVVIPGERRVLVRITEGLDTRLELRDPVLGSAEVVYRSPGDLVGAVGRRTETGLVLGFVESTPERLFEVCAGPAESPRPVSRHGAPLAEVRWGAVEDFRWQSG